MDLHLNSCLTIEYLHKVKKCVSFDLVVGQAPYYDCDEDEDLQYRREYVDLCVQLAQIIWHKCNFSDDLTILFEDRYSHYNKGEKEYIENCANSKNCNTYPFEWYDEDEKFICKINGGYL